jgi:hypothetical protein
VPTTSAGSPSYIRAGGGVDVRGSRVAAIAVVTIAVVLGVSAITLTVGAVHRNARMDDLRRGGVAVPVTVTGCVAISSGVGMGTEYWQCRGSYRVAGQTHNEVIGGSRQLLATGQTVHGVASRAHPTVLSTAASLARRRSTWTSFVVPALLGAAAIVLAFGYLVIAGRLRSRADRTASAAGGA